MSRAILFFDVIGIIVVFFVDETDFSHFSTIFATANNDLTSLPSEIGYMTSLEALWLGQCIVSSRI